MLVHIFGAKCIGIDAVKVTVEVDITMGIGIHLCGLGDIAVKESLLRTITALQSLNYHIPGKKIVINLAPADLHKSGSGYDLPIAIGIIAASQQRTLPLLGETLVMGELGLDGSVRPIKGGLPIADFAAKNGFKKCILPYSSALEASEMDGIDVYGIRSLEDAFGILEGKEEFDSLKVNTADFDFSREVQPISYEVDFSDIIGQEGAKRAMEIAASGGHNIIMIGAPGSGKSSMAKALAGILPPMSKEESFTCSKIYSIAGLGDLSKGLMKNRPYRSPHYSASMAAIIGGGGGSENIIPGEVTLAHQGVLFLDEFPPPVFGFRMDIGVEIVDRHISHAGQLIQDGRTARAAAGMEQDPRLDAFLLPTAGHALEYVIEVDPLVLIHAVQNFMKINHRLYSHFLI